MNRFVFFKRLLLYLTINLLNPNRVYYIITFVFFNLTLTGNSLKKPVKLKSNVIWEMNSKIPR